MSETEELKSTIKILEKEVKFSDTKRQETINQMSSLESELRLVTRQKNEIEEKLTTTRLSKDSQSDILERLNFEKSKHMGQID
jgi:chromosome segregation ATPase